MKRTVLSHIIAILLGCAAFSGCHPPRDTVREATAPDEVYTVASAHSHNDYEQATPFRMAYKAGFGSIEADVFLRNGELFVAHDLVDIRPGRTLEILYLKPLAEAKEQRQLQLLIDLKTGADSTLPVLIRQLSGYAFIAGGREQKTGGVDQKERPVKVVVSGSRPPLDAWPDVPAFIYFDGRPAETYTARVLEKVGLISDSFGNYTDWNGQQPLDSVTKQRLDNVVQQAHKLGKPFRFWAVPDTPLAWRLMTELGVDYINTDKIEALAAWLNKSR